MSQERRSTLRAQWLGQLMRQVREANGLTRAQAAEFLNRDASGLSRFETGAFPMPHRDVEALLSGLYQIDDERQRDVLLRLSEEVWRTDWWDGYASEVGQSFIDYVWLESRATEIRSFCISTLDGLLQTAEYARAVIEAAQPEDSEQQIERWVELRLQRQAILGRRRAPRLSVVLDEALLHRTVGGPEVLAAQLRHLVEQTGRPHIVIRVLPAASGAHASPNGEFRIFGMTDPYSEVVCVDSPAGQIFLEPPRTDRLSATYGYVLRDALDPDASVERIQAVANELDPR